MNKIQEDTLNMYQAVDGVLQSHSSVWSANTPFSDAVDTLEGNIDAIGDLVEQQEEDKTGVTDDKLEARTDLEEKTFTMGKAIAFYASTTGNRALQNKVNFTRTELGRARDNEVPGMSSQVHEEAVANSVALAAFGITPLMISALNTSISTFVTQISKPREALAETSAATDQLPALFDATTKLLEEQLDAGMELYRVSNPDFYAQYFNARIIVNSPTQTRALEVHFEELVGGAPVEHVKVNVDGTIHRRSSKLGNIRVQSLTEGAHHLDTVIPGYDNASADFNVISGETTKLTIKLTKTV